MRHPFDLDTEDLKSYSGQVHSLTQDLEFEDSVSLKEAEIAGAGLSPFPSSKGWRKFRLSLKHCRAEFLDCKQESHDEPIFTTQALGEEGGFYPHPPVTTYALGEEGGFTPEPAPEVTTLAMGEEGGEMALM